MKKFISILLAMLMVLSISFTGFAEEIQTPSAFGYAYNLYTLDKISFLSNLSINKDSNNINLSFTYNSEVYNISFEKNANSEYESYFLHNGKNFYSIIKENGNEYAGFVRDITTIANPKTLQFGFIISDNNTQIQTYSDNIETNAISGSLKDEVQHNREVLSGRRIDLNPVTRAVQHVGCYAWNNTSFAEMWANLSMTGSYKSATITQYNIIIGATGDGCYLRQYNNSGYNAYLWSSPLNPPRGLQSVNSTYHIPWDYMGALDVTVTGWYDMRGVPVPVPFIYADGYDF